MNACDPSWWYWSFKPLIEIIGGMLVVVLMMAIIVMAFYISEKVNKK